MRQNIINTDIVESLRANEPLEDDIFLQMEKIDALCSIRAAVDAGETAMSSRKMTYFSMIMEQEVKALRKLLDQVFS